MRTMILRRLPLKTPVLIALLLVAAPALHVQAAIEDSFRVDIPSMPLAQALKALADQGDFQIVFAADAVKDFNAPKLAGEMRAEQALNTLLAGTKLGFVRVADTYVIKAPGAKTSAQASEAGGNEVPLRLAQTGVSPVENQVKTLEQKQTDEIVVIGTNIRGVYPRSAPVEIYSAEDIARTGATTTEQFIRKMPQNLGTRSQFAVGAGGAIGGGAFGFNNNAVNAIDLRGLGVGTTLTLLNGRRLGMSDSGQSVDVSLIPVSAIERIEVLTDGASAIYGSDAVGGVVNFVLRKDFDGARTSASYGGVTSGNLRQKDFSQALGHRWSSGHGLLSYNYYSASELDVADRDYAALAGPGMLTPQDKRHNALASFSQQLGERLALQGDLAFARRKIDNAYSNVNAPLPTLYNFITYASDTDQYFANLGLDYAVRPSLSAAFNVSYSRLKAEAGWLANEYNRVPPRLTQRDYGTNHELIDATAKLDGALFSLPAGSARFSIGGGVLDEEFAGVSPVSTRQSAGTLGRRTAYVFGEVFVPLAGTLELSLAARYTRLEDDSKPAVDRDFGDSTDPKVGLSWAPFPSLGLRATYGSAFRAPSLTQTDPTAGLNSLSVTTIAGQTATQLSLNSYATPDLQPETADTFTVGFDYRPAFVPGLKITGTYYSIEYTDRIGTAPTAGINPQANPQLLPDVIYRAPSAAFIAEQLRTSANSLNQSGVNLADPNAAALLFALPNLWIYDRRFRNLALSEQHGFDIAIDGERDLMGGRLRLGAKVTRILDYDQQGSPNAAVLSVMDTALYPVSLRGRAQAGFSRGGFDGTVNLNYTDDYGNPFAVGGPQKISSWTTLDLSVGYDFDLVKLTLSVQNAMDKDPPFLAGQLSIPVGFDIANANPLGRLVTVGLSKEW